MAIKIKLRRLNQTDDDFGGYFEEVGVNYKGKLLYRASACTCYNYGAWKPWEDEDVALKFLLGRNILESIDYEARQYLRITFGKMPDLANIDVVDKKLKIEKKGVTVNL